MQKSKAHPYFIWNADLTEDDARRILASGSNYSRVQMMSTILHYAHFHDIWKYLSVRDAERRDYWKWILTLWGYPPDECADPVAAQLGCLSWASHESGGEIVASRYAQNDQTARSG
jgi:hypothetical protein